MTNEDIEQVAMALEPHGHDPEYYASAKEIADEIRKLVAQAYEEAAQVSENCYLHGHDAHLGKHIAHRIRNLKESPVEASPSKNLLHE